MVEERNYVPEIGSEDELETAATAGAAAVQKLIADRNQLRNYVNLLKSELSASRAAEEEQKRRLGILRQRYIELARRIISQLHLFDRELSVAASESTGSVSAAPENFTVTKMQFDGNGLPVDAHLPNGNGTVSANRPLPLEP
jgi:hypothetical protein